MPLDPTLEPKKSPDQQPLDKLSTVDGTGAYHPEADTTVPHVAAVEVLADAIQISGYIITGELARGGMGCVLAGRELALDREVAIKTLLPHAGATRFITEAKITAKLPHPSIPPVYALGSLSDGSPYLAMKLVRGQTLADQLKARSHTLDGLPRFLQIFEQIAQAVGFAHAQRVIHRDLKPANVMVGAFGEVQVMDWGLAKDLRSTAPSPQLVLEEHPHDPGATIAYANNTPTPGRDETRSGMILGTPTYMAPEQARGEVATPQSDVFALGGILCSILTGKAVFGGTTVIETVKQAAAGNTTAALTRLQASGAEEEVITLAMQCLAVNPVERPHDGQAVAMLVAAYRQSVEERLKKAETAKAESLVREAEQRKRRRQLQMAGTTVFLTLLTGLGVSIWQMNQTIAAEAQAKLNEKLAWDERDAKDVALKSEQAARQEAETNLGYAKEGNRILGSVFEGLDPKAVYKSISDLRIALRNNLQKAVKQLEGSSIGDPMVVAEMQNTLGLSLLGLGESKSASTLFAKSRDTRKAKLGPDHRDTLLSNANLAAAYIDTGKFDLALPLLEESLKLQKTKLGSDNPQTLASMSNLAVGYQDAGKLNQALQLYEETLNLRKIRLGNQHPDTLTSMANLAQAYRAVGNLKMALPLYKETLILMKANLGDDHPSTLTLMANLATSYLDSGKLDLAMPLLEETLKLRKAKLGDDHPDTLSSMHNLAASYKAAGKQERAQQLYEETVFHRKSKLGQEHPNTLLSMSNLAASYIATGKFGVALPLLEETLKLQKTNLGLDHPNTLQSMSNLAIAYKAVGKLDQALPLHEEVLTLVKAKLGPDHPHTITSMGNLGAAYCAAKQGEKASLTLKEFVTARRKKSQREDLQFAGLLAQVSLELVKCEQYDVAEEMLRECLLIREKKEPDVWSTFSIQSLLGSAMLGQKKYTEAEPLLLKGYESMKAREKTIPPQGKARIPEALDRIIQLYTETNKPEEVKKWQAEKDTLAVRRDKNP